MAEPNCIPVAEAARVANVTPGRIRQLMAGGEVGSIFFAGAKPLVNVASLQRWMEQREAKRQKGKAADGSGRS